VYGILTAVDTLAPQTYAAGNHAEVGVLTLRGIIVVFSTFPFTIAIWLNAETILVAIGQPLIQAQYAAQFLQIYLVGLPGLCLWESARRFMWSQNVSQWYRYFSFPLPIYVYTKTNKRTPNPSLSLSLSSL